MVRSLLGHDGWDMDDAMVVSVAGMKEAFRAALAPREKQKGRISAEIVPRSYDNTVKQK